MQQLVVVLFTTVVFWSFPDILQVHAENAMPLAPNFTEEEGWEPYEKNNTAMKLDKSITLLSGASTTCSITMAKGKGFANYSQPRVAGGKPEEGGVAFYDPHGKLIIKMWGSQHGSEPLHTVFLGSDNTTWYYSHDPQETRIFTVLKKIPPGETCGPVSYDLDFYNVRTEKTIAKRSYVDIPMQQQLEEDPEPHSEPYEIQLL